jgi:hypothetical protein
MTADTRPWVTGVEVTQRNDGLMPSLTLRARMLGREWDLTAKTGTTEGRCGEMLVERYYVCPLWAGHDGPHVPLTFELDVHVGGVVITSLRTHKDSSGSKHE